MPLFLDEADDVMRGLQAQLQADWDRFSREEVDAVQTMIDAHRTLLIERVPLAAHDPDPVTDDCRAEETRHDQAVAAAMRQQHTFLGFTHVCAKCGGRWEEILEILDSLVPICDPLAVEGLRKAQSKFEAAQWATRNPEAALGLGVEFPADFDMTAAIEAAREHNQKAAAAALAKSLFGDGVGSRAHGNGLAQSAAAAIEAREKIAAEVFECVFTREGYGKLGEHEARRLAAEAEARFAPPAPIEPHERPMSKSIIDEWTRRR